VIVRGVIVVGEGEVIDTFESVTNSECIIVGRLRKAPSQSDTRQPYQRASELP